MKEDERQSNEAIWAYLHGESGEGERRALEQALLLDPALRSRVGRARQLDRLLRATLTAPGAGEAADDTLADQALAAWERDCASSAASSASAPRAAAERPLGRSRFIRPSAGLIGLAAAALLLLAVSPALRVSRGVEWAEPVYAPLAFRGPNAPAGEAAVDKAAAVRCQEALKAALSSACDARGLRLPAGLSVSLRLQALRGSAFSVSVQARLRGGRTVGEWRGDYSSLDAFLAHAAASAAGMADELAPYSGGGDRGGRP